MLQRRIPRIAALAIAIALPAQAARIENTQMEFLGECPEGSDLLAGQSDDPRAPDLVQEILEQ